LAIVNASDLVALGGGGGGGRLLDRQIFNSSGTWTKPADYAGNVALGEATQVVVYLIGAGAGGNAGATGGFPSAGGAGGGLTISSLAVSVLGATETVTLGAGGAGGPTGGLGSAGGNSVFGTYCAAGGGEASVSTSVGGLGGVGVLTGAGG